MSMSRMLTSWPKTRSEVPVTSRGTVDHAVFTMLAVVISTGELRMYILVDSRTASFVVPVCGTAYGSLVIVESLRRPCQKASASSVCWRAICHAYRVKSAGIPGSPPRSWLTAHRSERLYAGKSCHIERVRAVLSGHAPPLHH